MERRIYSRRTVLGGVLGMAAFGTGGGGPVRPLKAMLGEWSNLPASDRMPVVFVGHGTPMSAIQPNQWTKRWAELGQELVKPKAILSISAHWLTRGGALVTANDAPRMNYDMSGFPDEIYKILYPAPGETKLAQEIAAALSPQLPVSGDSKWGFDHATWVVLKYMFPKADVPVIQLSIDYSKPPSFHYEIGKHLQFLRAKGVLILGSGNIVHNLQKRPGTNNDQPYDWAVQFDHTMNDYVQDGNYQGVIDFQKLGGVALLAHPTYDHFLPLLYCLGLKTQKDEVRTFSDNFQWPAVSMRSFVIA